MRYFITLTTLIFFCAPALQAREIAHGLAMHGDPKYNRDFSHLSYTEPSATKGGTLKQCALGTFDTLNDNTIKGKPAEGLYLINDPLMRRVWDEPFTLYGVIAKEAITPADRSSIMFILNPDAIFHDGSRITTADVAFSFETLKEKGKPNTRNVYKLVDTVEIIDDYTIRFNFNGNHDRETPLILAMMPVLPKAYWKNREFDATTLDIPLGNGPYKIASLNPGKEIIYEKVPDYWAKDLGVNKGHYNFDRMAFDYYRDVQVAREAFKSRECDVMREFNPAQWQAAYSPDEGYIMESLPHARPEKAAGFIFNTRRTPFHDVRVRQALTIAFDFDWVNSALLRGEGKPITSTFPNSSLAASTQYTAMEKRDRLRRADDLLNAAGYVLNDGKRFAFTLLLNNPAEEKIALAYARDLKRLGITMTIRTLDTAQFYGALNDYDYDMVSWRWVNSLSPGTEQAIYWGCAAAKTIGSRNYAGLCDPDIDAAITALTKSTTYDQLTARTQHLDRLIMAQYPFIPLYYMGVDNVAYWPWIHHPKTQSLYGMVLETWWREPTAKE